jgi:hypothetical protein
MKLPKITRTYYYAFIMVFLSILLTVGVVNVLIHKPDSAEANGSQPFAINVTASPYNAQCDGSTDDTTAFNNALAAFPSTGGRLLIPASSNVCKITSTLNVPDNVIIEGESRTASVIWCDFNSGACIQFGNTSRTSSTETMNGGLEHLGIEGNSKSNSGTSGVNFFAAQGGFINDVLVQFVESAFVINGGPSSAFSADETFTAPYTNNVVNGIKTTASGGIVTDFHCCGGGYIFGTSSHNAGDAFSLNSLNTSYLTQWSMEGFNYGIHLTGNDSADTFNGGRSEHMGSDNGTQSYVCDSSTDVDGLFDNLNDADVDEANQVSVTVSNSAECNMN